LGLFEMPMPAGCVHMMLEVNDVDEVGRCNDRRIAADVKLTGTLGRHANDHMVSFYMRSPSGFDIEIGAEGRIVDDWSAYQVFESTVPSFWGHDFSVGQED
jgi:3,4-dihydroxy-9,10-secoandrosta-1,3,5(10)-triene-9,17-dione 4,5-dioxygenase